MAAPGQVNNRGSNLGKTEGQINNNSVAVITEEAVQGASKRPIVDSDGACVFVSVNVSPSKGGGPTHNNLNIGLDLNGVNHIIKGVIGPDTKEVCDIVVGGAKS